MTAYSMKREPTANEVTHVGGANNQARTAYALYSQHALTKDITATDDARLARSTPYQHATQQAKHAESTSSAQDLAQFEDYMASSQTDR